jgi:hypothetical protein
MAGFNGQIFDNTKSILSAENVAMVFPGKAVRTSKGFSYSKAYTSSLVDEVRDIAKSRASDEKGIFLCVVYFPHQRFKILLDEFWPSSVNYEISMSLLSAPSNNAIRKVVSCVRHFQRLTKELNILYTQEIRRTPWVLPIQNYHTPAFRELLEAASAPNMMADVGFPYKKDISELPKGVSKSPKMSVYKDVCIYRPTRGFIYSITASRFSWI